MQQRELVVGFSELKDLLIRIFQIEREKSIVKLYFSEEGIELLMHDHDDHKKTITLSRDMSNKDIRKGLGNRSHILIKEALLHSSPSNYLNEEFKLNGFFIS